MKIKEVKKSKLPLEEKKKGRKLAKVALVCLLCSSWIFCKREYEPKENSIWNNFLPEHSDELEWYDEKMSEETDLTLSKYNSWLQKKGVNQRLTKEDLEFIETNTNPTCANNGVFSIKLQNNEYIQVGNEYFVVENADEKVELIPGFGFENEYDLFTGNKRKTIDYTILGSFGDYVLENDIQIIGYIPQKWTYCSDRDKEFIKENYNEDILRCLQENGLPLPCYDVEDFYKINNKSNFNILGLTLETK